MAVRKKATKTKSGNKRATTKIKVRKVSTSKKTVKAALTKAPKKLEKVQSPYTKTMLLTTLAERTGLKKQDVSSVLDQLGTVLNGHVKKGGVGQFVLPGLLKVIIKDIPAKSAREGINPFTGEKMMFKAKPASKKVKITPLKKLKEMVV